MCFEYQRCAEKENQISVMNYEKSLKLHIISGQGNTLPFQVMIKILYGGFFLLGSSSFNIIAKEQNTLKHSHYLLLRGSFGDAKSNSKAKLSLLILY